MLLETFKVDVKKAEVEQRYWRYWGKAQAKADSLAEYHLLPCHCLDVAAVGAVYLRHHAVLRADWASRLQLTEAALSEWLVFFLSQHDLGKFSYRFQGLRPDICQRLENLQPHQNYTVRHDTLGQVLFERTINSWAIEQAWFGRCADADDQEYWADNFNALARTATGHHGQPPNLGECRDPQKQFSPFDQAAALAFATDCARLLLPENPGSLPDGERFSEPLNPLTWRLAGLAVLCDWLGSNEAFFSYRTEPMPLTDYWRKYALPQAEKALAEANLLPRTVRPQSLAELFGYLKQPTLLQRTAAELPREATAAVVVHMFYINAQHRRGVAI